MSPATVPGPDGRPRCAWAVEPGWPPYLTYHDTEWGRPLHDDTALFEHLALESFQAGLSWRTMLAKRDRFRQVFADFDIATVARYGQAEVEQLMTDPGIVRNRRKIEAVIGNARAARQLIAEEGSLAGYVWRWVPPAEELGEPLTATTSPTAIALSRDLKQRGWRFVGPTTTFAFMEAVGLVNDHASGCVFRDVVERARRDMIMPTD